jgi:hypothetical protein
MRGEERDEAAMVVGGTADLGFNATKARCNNHAVHAARILVRRILAPLIVAVWLTGISPACAQTNDFQKWDHYGGGDHGMQYSSLSQITTDNVGSLEEAWRFRTGELGQGHREPFAGPRDR